MKHAWLMCPLHIPWKHIFYFNYEPELINIEIWYFCPLASSSTHILLCTSSLWAPDSPVLDPLCLAPTHHMLKLPKYETCRIILLGLDTMESMLVLGVGLIYHIKIMCVNDFCSQVEEPIAMTSSIRYVNAVNWYWHKKIHSMQLSPFGRQKLNAYMNKNLILIMRHAGSDMRSFERNLNSM